MPPALEEAYPFSVTVISCPDGSITAKFVPFGATLTELWVRDRKGEKRNVVLGYDDNSKLETDPDHPVFNAVVGRYANRIANGSFTISDVEDSSSHLSCQLPINDGPNTLHGGILGWDRRKWRLHRSDETSVTYKHVDQADEGFPGWVTALATFQVKSGGVLTINITADATEKTPIMVTQHIYWNLDAYQGPSSDVLAHNLQLGASQILEVDKQGIPTGHILDVEGTVFDFRNRRSLGSKWDQTSDVTAGGAPGYNNCWIFEKSRNVLEPCISLWSEESGIKLDIQTNQPAVQIYTGHWLNTPRRSVHGGPEKYYTKHTAIAIEQQSFTNAINLPEWGVDQIYNPRRAYCWTSSYIFSVL